MSFEKLMGALAAIKDQETLSKAQSSDDANKDAKVAAAAADGAAASTAADGNKGDDNANAGGEGQGGAAAEAGSADADAGKGSGEGAGKAAEDCAAEGAGKEGQMGKSFSATSENGEKFEAIDATDLLKSFCEELKSFSSRLEGNEGKTQEVLGKAIEIISGQGASIATLTKSLTEQSAAIAEQAEMVKSLRADIDVLRNAPAGRKSVANPAQVSTDSPLAKSLSNDGKSEGMKSQEFLAKCLDLQRNGRMSLQEVAMAEAAIGSNVAVPEPIVTKVFSSK